ncbi:hypothetical protein EYF80_002108 [Liparis tanakae]|uniref:Uncharacterized protein n=1 Tax=Liparis tanakae TaxID=230148 RepID=A0A4Z2JCM1_9TELE|nr:hypothetical protein EYF80_002108 [Liparis tanakae]
MHSMFNPDTHMVDHGNTRSLRRESELKRVMRLAGGAEAGAVGVGPLPKTTRRRGSQTQSISDPDPHRTTPDITPRGVSSRDVSVTTKRCFFRSTFRGGLKRDHHGDDDDNGQQSANHDADDLA